MTTIRLTASQKHKLERVAQVLGAILGRKLSQGEAVEALADFAARNRDLLARSVPDMERPLPDDPFFDATLTVDVGRTDERTHDRLLYGKG